MLRQYVSGFAPEDAPYAVEYFLLVYPTSLRDNCIKDLLLETRQFDVILEKVGDSAQSILQMAAASSESQGKYEDAIKLYQRAHVSLSPNIFDHHAELFQNHSHPERSTQSNPHK